VIVEGKLVWFFDASVECYKAGWQTAAFVVIGLLSPVPLALIVSLSKNFKISENFCEEIQHVLTNGAAFLPSFSLFSHPILPRDRLSRRAALLAGHQSVPPISSRGTCFTRSSD
jgi:hypothetical protein